VSREVLNQHARAVGVAAGQFAVPGADWQENLGSSDYQRIAAEADRLGFDAVSVPEHVVLPRELAGHMGGRWPDAMAVSGDTAAVRPPARWPGV
jgi:alkanesulfonate monooxygenase SsuD/methylene tetrahydromethanopterin reductase-like flavin-dependent oxidoreductase (luciferase family)